MANQSGDFFHRFSGLPPTRALNKGYIVIGQRILLNRTAQPEFEAFDARAMIFPLCNRKKRRCLVQTPAPGTQLPAPWKLVPAAFCWWLAAVAAAAEPGDVWLISSRAAGCSPDPQHLQIRRQRHGCFVAQTLNQFLQEQRPEVPLVFWVHGNRVSASAAPTIGLRVYRALARQSPGRFQMVIWSWPSARQGGALRDARLKAAAADQHGRHLAQVLRLLANRPRVGLIGYSYGARLILSALHVLDSASAGDSSRVQEPAPPELRYRVVLWVPGVEHSALAPGGRFGRAWNRVHRMLLVTNCSDRALRWYPWVDGPHGPEALGRVGPSGLAPWQQQRLRWLEASSEVGPQHDWVLMLSAPGVLVPSAQLLLLEAQPASSPGS